MTKTTEELKREMYGKLAAFRIHAVMLDDLEQSMEAYLEALRQDLKMSHVATGDIAILLHETKSERDELRNRLQAFEFANKSAGELLIEAQATIKRQREFIRTLYTSRKARKAKGSTSAQSSDEKAVRETLGAVQRLCQHSWWTVIAYPAGNEKKECIFCLKIED